VIYKLPLLGTQLRQAIQPELVLYGLDIVEDLQWSRRENPKKFLILIFSDVVRDNLGLPVWTWPTRVLKSRLQNFYFNVGILRFQA